LAKKRESALKTILNTTQEKAQWVSIRKWTIALFTHKRIKAQQKIDVQVSENNRLKQCISSEEQDFAQNIENLKLEGEKLEVEKNRYKKQYQNAVEILNNRMQNNVVVDKRRTILVTWCNYVKKQKSCMNNLMRIMLKNVKRNSMETWRTYSYETQKAKEKHSKLRRFVRAVSTVHTRKAFSSWRVINYNQVTYSMFECIKDFEESKVQHEKDIKALHKKK